MIAEGPTSAVGDRIPEVGIELGKDNGPEFAIGPALIEGSAA